MTRPQSKCPFCGEDHDPETRCANLPPGEYIGGSPTTPTATATTSVQPADKPKAEPALLRLSEVKPLPVDWLWPGRFPIGKLSLIVGDPCLGKSFLTLDIAARVSRGSPWPDRPHEPNPAGGVVLLSAEDDPADTIVPRLTAAGADLQRINVLQGVQRPIGNGESRVCAFNLAEDLITLQQAIKATPDCRLVVIDPISAYLGRTDSYVNAEMRGLLGPLADLAARCRVVVAAVSHLRKSGDGPAIHKTQGSLAFVAAARAVWAVAKDKQDPARRLFVPVKCNLAAEQTGLAYSLRSEGVSAVVAWEAKPVTLTADQVTAYEQPKGDAVGEAVEWLRAALANGPVAGKELLAKAQSDGISERTLHRAKAELCIVSRRAEWSGGWVWLLPKVANEDCQPIYTPWQPSAGDPENAICEQSDQGCQPQDIQLGNLGDGLDGGNGRHPPAPEGWSTEGWERRLAAMQPGP